MKPKRTVFRLLAMSLTILLACLAMVSCGLMVYDEEREMGERFISYIVTDNAAGAYARFAHSEAMTAEKFEVLWAELRAFADGATEAEVTDYRMEGNISSVVNDRHHIYTVRFDNGRTIILDLFIDGMEGGGGDFTTCTYRDVTAFVRKTAVVIPVLAVVLTVCTVLALGLTIWMIVDCARRKLKCKFLWIVALLAGVSVTFAIGEQGGMSFFVGLFLQASYITTDIESMTVTTKLVFPIGSIVYFFLRKRLTRPAEAGERVD